MGCSWFFPRWYGRVGFRSGEYVADGDGVARAAAQVNTFEAGPITYGGRIVASSVN